MSTIAGATDAAAVTSAGQSVGADLLTARPDGPAEWCGHRLRARSPLIAAIAVAAAAWVALAALMMGIGVVLVEFGVPSSIGEWDGQVVSAFVDQRTGVLTDVSAVGSGLADTITVVAVGSLLAVALAVKRAWFLVGLVVLSLVAEVTIYLAVTHTVHRQRPIVEQLEQLRPRASYPSGHTAAAVALYIAIAAVVSVYVASTVARNVAWTAAALVPLVVALSRVYRGMHHPTDAMAGLIMGIGCVVIAVFAVRTAGVVARSREARHVRTRSA